jgi:hypothetical protein
MIKLTGEHLLTNDCSSPPPHDTKRAVLRSDEGIGVHIKSYISISEIQTSVNPAQAGA